ARAEVQIVGPGEGKVAVPALCIVVAQRQRAAAGVINRCSATNGEGPSAGCGSIVKVECTGAQCRAAGKGVRASQGESTRAGFGKAKGIAADRAANREIAAANRYRTTGAHCHSTRAEIQIPGAGEGKVAI